MFLNAQEIVVNDIIFCNTGSYQIKAMKGQGCYGRVVQAIDHWKRKIVAIKISPLKCIRQTKNEVYALKTLSRQSKNVVKFIQYFVYRGNCCLVMEYLDQCLFDLMDKRQYKPLDLSDIRYITEQLLEVFEELAKYKLVHGDLKPDNIMLVNHRHEPFNIKLIDFGLSSTVRELVPGSSIQGIGYRSPEVSLGTKLDEAVDMWSVGCVLAFLFTGKHLFPINCEYEMMRIITQIQGMPDVQQLKEGLYTGHFFKETHGHYHLNSPKEYVKKTNKPYSPCKNMSKSFTSLDDMLVYRPESTLEDRVEIRQFFDLLNKILDVNPVKRITPGRALTHPFIKQTTDPRKSIYNHLKGTETAHPESCKKTARKSKHLSMSEDESTLETTNVKMQEHVPTAWVSGNVETESDDDYASKCSKAERSVKTVQVKPVIQNEPGRKVTSTDVGFSPGMPKCTQGGSTISPESCKKTARKSKHLSMSEDESTLETTNVKIQKIQECVPPGLVRRNVEMETLSRVFKNSRKYLKLHINKMSSNIQDIALRVNDVISGDFGSYQIKKQKGEGNCGSVFQCIDCLTGKNVAIKISQLNNIRATKKEVYALLTLSKNVVKFIQFFQYQDYHCLVTECWNHSLYDLIIIRQYKPLDLSDIRYITEQLLEALEELAKYKLVHGDLKPDNIMLVNHKLEPFKIKLINFGFSTTVGKLVPGSLIQTTGYRAPEVSLGTKLDEAVDMWSVGCVLAFLFIGKHLFPFHCEYEMMRIILQIQGIPDVQQLKEGLFTGHFFKETRGRYNLHSPKEYVKKTHKPYSPCKNMSKMFSSLDDMAGYRPTSITDDRMKTRQFFIILNKILQVNPVKRITPGRALTHPFIKQTTDPRKCINSTQTAHPSVVGRISCSFSGSKGKCERVKQQNIKKSVQHAKPVIQNEPGRKVTSTDVGCSLCITKCTQGSNRISPECCKKTARKSKSNSEDESTLERTNVKMQQIQERVPPGLVSRNVEIESDDDYKSKCSKAERPFKTVQVKPVIQNEPGRKVTNTDGGCSSCMPKCTQCGNRISPELCKKTAIKSKHLSNSEDESTLETANVKMQQIQERVPTAWFSGNVETESDDDYESKCSKAERSVKTVQVKPVIQNEQGRKVSSTDVGTLKTTDVKIHKIQELMPPELVSRNVEMSRFPDLGNQILFDPHNPRKDEQEMSGQGKHNPGTTGPRQTKLPTHGPIKKWPASQANEANTANGSNTMESSSSPVEGQGSDGPDKESHGAILSEELEEVTLNRLALRMCEIKCEMQREMALVRAEMRAAIGSARLAQFENDIRELKEAGLNGARVEETEQRISGNSDELQTLRAKMVTLQTENENMKSKILDLESRSHRLNLRLEGLPEGEEGEDTESYLEKIVPELL